MKGLLDSLRKLGMAPILALTGVLIGMIGIVAFLELGGVSTSRMTLLYSDLDLHDSEQIVDQLAEQGRMDANPCRSIELDLLLKISTARVARPLEQMLANPRNQLDGLQVRPAGLCLCPGHKKESVHNLTELDGLAVHVGQNALILTDTALAPPRIAPSGPPAPIVRSGSQ